MTSVRSDVCSICSRLISDSVETDISPLCSICDAGIRPFRDPPEVLRFTISYLENYLRRQSLETSDGVGISGRRQDSCKNGHVLSEVGTYADGKGTLCCVRCRKDRVIRSRSRFYVRRANVCESLGLVHIVCSRNHRLDLENALLKNGFCRECHREDAQRRRDANKARGLDSRGRAFKES